MNWLEKLDDSEKKAWEEVMLRHAFDASEWKDADKVLVELLQESDKQADQSSRRAYLDCCAEASGSVQPLPYLPDLVREFYLAYGMDNSKSSTSGNK